MQAEADAAPETGRKPIETEEAKPFAPDEKWVAEFEAQLTTTLMDGVRNYARPRAFKVAAAGRKVDDYYARELVQDAVGDTWTGVLAWEPARCTLEHHLIRAVQSRSDKHFKHAIANPHDALGDNTRASRAAESAASGMNGYLANVTQRVYSRETVALIRAEAAGDNALLRILDAYLAGAETKADVMTHTRMRDRTYHNAYGRMKRIVRGLTDIKLASQGRA